MHDEELGHKAKRPVCGLIAFLVPILAFAVTVAFQWYHQTFGVDTIGAAGFAMAMILFVPTFLCSLIFGVVSLCRGERPRVFAILALLFVVAPIIFALVAGFLEQLLAD